MVLTSPSHARFINPVAVDTGAVRVAHTLSTKTLLAKVPCLIWPFAIGGKALRRAANLRIV
jgi:hypothetical protein